jgi:hypothetical protein
VGSAAMAQATSRKTILQVHIEDCKTLRTKLIICPPLLLIDDTSNNENLLGSAFIPIITNTRYYLPLVTTITYLGKYDQEKYFVLWYREAKEYPPVRSAQSIV